VRELGPSKSNPSTPLANCAALVHPLPRGRNDDQSPLIEHCMPMRSIRRGLGALNDVIRITVPASIRIHNLECLSESTDVQRPVRELQQRVAKEKAVLTQRHKDHKGLQCDRPAEQITHAVICPTFSMICCPSCSLCLCVSSYRISGDCYFLMSPDTLATASRVTPTGERLVDRRQQASGHISSKTRDKEPVGVQGGNLGAR